MKNNDLLKEKILKNVKENIAISNICEEMGVAKKKERRIFVIKTLSACAAVVVIGAIWINVSNINMITHSLGQTAMDSMLVGKNEMTQGVPGIQSSASSVENKTDISEAIKDPMSDSANVEFDDNYRGNSTDDLKQNANSEMIVPDKVINAPSEGMTNVEESFSIKKLIKNIIEIISSIF